MCRNPRTAEGTVEGREICQGTGHVTRSSFSGWFSSFLFRFGKETYVIKLHKYTFTKYSMLKFRFLFLASFFKKFKKHTHTYQSILRINLETLNRVFTCLRA